MCVPECITYAHTLSLSLTKKTILFAGGIHGVTRHGATYLPGGYATEQSIFM